MKDLLIVYSIHFPLDKGGPGVLWFLALFSRLPRRERAVLLSYLPVIIMIGFVTFLAFAVLFINRLVSPKNPYKEKLSPWECGMEPIGEASVGQFKVHFFIIAILFIVFDVETLYLFPWAVVLREIGVVAFVEMFIFIAIILIGLIYAWVKGALEWV